MSNLFPNHYLSNTNLPFYDMVVSIVSRLRNLGFTSQFNESVYAYPRKDLSNLALPALLVYPSYITTKQSGFFWRSMITIEIVRNVTETNRGAIYDFHQNIAERIIQAICLDNEFYFRSLTRGRDYITRFGDSFDSFYNEERHASTIDILAEIYYPKYKEWASRNAFNFDDKGLKIYIVNDFGTEVNIINSIPTQPKDMIGTNTLTKTQTGVDIAGTDDMLRIWAEQLAIQSDSSGNKFVEATHQPISINGEATIYDQGTGNKVTEILRPTVDSCAKVFLRDGSLVDGDICWISYNF